MAGGAYVVMFTSVNGASVKRRVVMNALIIGLGNDYRSDDAVGRVVARKLQAESLDGVRILEETGEGATLIEVWRGADFVILIDAVHSGGEPGEIYRIDANRQQVPRSFFRCSTHAFSVAEAVEMARALGQLPRRLIIYGIEGKNFASGVGLCPVIERAAEETVHRVKAELCMSFP
jgi:hydrogenase maturation protease